MATVKYFNYENQSGTWKLKKTIEVNETDMLTKFANSNVLTNQKPECFFNKFDCIKDNGEMVGSILTLNPHLFI